MISRRLLAGAVFLFALLASHEQINAQEVARENIGVLVVDMRALS